LILAAVRRYYHTII